MAELDVEALKRLEKSEDCVEIAAEVQPMLPTIIAALEERDRLRAALDMACRWMEQSIRDNYDGTAGVDERLARVAELRTKLR